MWQALDVQKNSLSTHPKLNVSYSIVSQPFQGADKQSFFFYFFFFKLFQYVYCLCSWMNFEKMFFSKSHGSLSGSMTLHFWRFFFWLSKIFMWSSWSPYDPISKPLNYIFHISFINFKENLIFRNSIYYYDQSAAESIQIKIGR